MKYFLSGLLVVGVTGIGVGVDLLNSTFGSSVIAFAIGCIVLSMFIYLD